MEDLLIVIGVSALVVVLRLLAEKFIENYWKDKVIYIVNHEK